MHIDHSPPTFSKQLNYSHASENASKPFRSHPRAMTYTSLLTNIKFHDILEQKKSPIGSRAFHYAVTHRWFSVLPIVADSPIFMQGVFCYV